MNQTEAKLPDEDLCDVVLWCRADLSAWCRLGTGKLWDKFGGRASIKFGVLSGLDPKPSELPMARLKSR